MENTEKKNPDLDTAVTVAIVELLVSPEYSQSWLEELVRDDERDLTAEEVEAVGIAVDRTLDQLAIPFVESLPEATRKVYRDILKRREAQAHPLNDEVPFLER